MINLETLGIIDDLQFFGRHNAKPIAFANLYQVSFCSIAENSNVFTKKRNLRLLVKKNFTTN